MFTYSWFWADTRLKGRDSIVVANNTRLIRHDDYIGLRLHATEVVKYHRDGTVSLHSGGWRTATTKERMHRFTDAWVSQIKGEWFVRWGSEEHPFADGMVLHPDGSVSGTMTPTELDERRAENAAATRALTRFIKGITPERIITAFDNTGGDCLLCRFGDTSCLALHVEEDYFHATLAYQAIAAKGYPNPSLIMALIRNSAERGTVDRMLTDSLRRYMKPHMVQGVATR